MSAVSLLAMGIVRDDLYQFDRVRQFLVRSDEAIKELLPTLKSLDSFIEGCRALDSTLPSTPKKRGRLIGEFPIHGMLIDLAGRTHLSVQRANLTLHVCAHAVSVLSSRRGEQAKTLNRVDEVCRHLRLMPDYELSQLPEKTIARREDLMAILERLTQGAHKLSGMRARARFVAIQTFLQPYVTYRPRNSERREARVLEESEIISPPQHDPDESSVVETLIRTQSDSERELTPEEHYRQGGSAYEAYSGQQLKQLEKYRPIDAAAVAMRVNHTALHTKRRNVVNPFQWEGLSQFEVLTLVQSLVENPSKAGVCLGLMLVTGRSENDILTASFAYSNRERYKGTAVLLDRRTPTWQFQLDLPESRRRVRQQWRHYLEPGQRWLSLPLPQFVADLIDSEFGDNKYGTLFPTTDHETIRAEVKERLGKLNRLHACRYTALRVSRNLFNTISSRGDVADACFITSQSPSFGQTAVLYYYRTSVSHLRNQYRSAMEYMIDAKPMWSADHSVEQGFLLDQFVGSEMKLRSEIIPLFVRHLVDAIDRARQNSKLVELHNQFTCYILFFVAFTTGHRAISGVLENEEDIDWRRGFLVIDDKAGVGNRGRLAPLVEDLKRQLQEYRKYRQALPRELQTYPSFFFFLNEDGAPEATTPTLLSKHRSDRLDLPLNLNRHFLRSELRRAGVSGEAVNLFLGHWDDGQEPAAHHSSISPLAYRDELIESLTEITKACKWIVVRVVG